MGTTAPATEAERLAALRDLRILDTPPEPHFDAVCRTARRLFGVAAATVSLVDADRQWLKTPCALMPSVVPRSITFCDHTIRDDAVLVVPDTTRDPRFAMGDLVVNAPSLRFYAGAPLILRPGVRVGAFCLLDTVPRTFSQEETEALRDLAEIVVAHLRLHEAAVLHARETAARQAHEAVIEAQKRELFSREAALSEANRRLRQAEAITDAGHFRVALDDGRPIWSDGLYRLVGLEVGSSLPCLPELFSLYHPAERERVMRTVQDAIRFGADYAYEARIVRTDGAVRDVAVRGICETDAAGRTRALFGTLVDITARKATDAAMALSEARYRSLAEAVPALVWAMRVEDGRMSYANAWFNDYYGPIGPARGERCARNHPEDAARMEAAWQEASRTGATFTVEGRLQRQDGVYRWHKIVMVPIARVDDAAPAEWLATAVDIDEIVTARMRLEETSGLLRIAQEASAAGAWDWDMRTGIVTLTPESAANHGLASEDSVVLDTSGWTQLVHPDDRAGIWEAVRHATESGMIYVGEYRTLSPAGLRWIHATGRVLYDTDGRPYRMVGLHCDIGERKRAEAALQAAIAEAETARREAEDASRAKGEFLAAMSHEIRTPLNGILGYAELLLEETRLVPEDRRRLELIQGAGVALLTVVNDVLDVSKIDGGQFALDPIDFPLHRMIDETMAIVRGGALKRPLEIAWHIDPQVPRHVHGDPNRLRQVLLNLLNNAVKFTPQGSVALTVCHEGLRRLPTGEGIEALRFAVTDTGIGIAPDKRDRLFKRFSQVDGSIGRRFGGTGLGLAICQGLVALMGGEIGLDSAEGRGSTFWFRIALARRAEPAATSPAPAAARTDTAAGRILLAEDVDINQEIICTILKGLGHRVDVVGDGAAAVRAVEEGAYDLVLMDVQMPGMDGLTATRTIRRLRMPAARVPIVALTANVLPSQVEALREAGADDHVGKPFKRAELMAAVTGWIAEGRRRRAGRPMAMPLQAFPIPAPPPEGLVLDRGTYEAVSETIGADLSRVLLLRLEKELQARFAAADVDPADRRALAQDAHAMVSAAGSLGFRGIADLCREIEAACGIDADLMPLLERLERVRASTLGTIRALRAA